MFVQSTLLAVIDTMPLLAEPMHFAARSMVYTIINDQTIVLLQHLIFVLLLIMLVILALGITYHIKQHAYRVHA